MLTSDNLYTTDTNEALLNNDEYKESIRSRRKKLKGRRIMSMCDSKDVD